MRLVPEVKGGGGECTYFYLILIFLLYTIYMELFYYLIAFGMICYCAYVFMPEVAFFWIERFMVYLRNILARQIVKERTYIEEQLEVLQREKEKVSEVLSEEKYLKLIAELKEDLNELDNEESELYRM